MKIENKRDSLCKHMRYRMLAADRRIFRFTFIKTLLTIKHCFEAYFSIKHVFFQDDKGKDSSIRAVTLEHFTNTFIYRLSSNVNISLVYYRLGHYELYKDVLLALALYLSMDFISSPVLVVVFIA